MTVHKQCDYLVFNRLKSEPKPGWLLRDKKRENKVDWRSLSAVKLLT